MFVNNSPIMPDNSDSGPPSFSNNDSTPRGSPHDSELDGDDCGNATHAPANKM